MDKKKKIVIEGIEFYLNPDLTLRQIKEITTTNVETERFFEIILVPCKGQKFDVEKVLDMKESQAEKIIKEFWEERKKKTEASIKSSMSSMLPNED